MARETNITEMLILTVLYNPCTFGEVWILDVQDVHPQRGLPQERDRDSQ